MPVHGRGFHTPRRAALPCPYPSSRHGAAVGFSPCATDPELPHRDASALPELRGGSLGEHVYSCPASRVSRAPLDTSSARVDRTRLRAARSHTTRWRRCSAIVQSASCERPRAARGGAVRNGERPASGSSGTQLFHVLGSTPPTPSSMRGRAHGGIRCSGRASDVLSPRHAGPRARARRAATDGRSSRAFRAGRTSGSPSSANRVSSGPFSGEHGRSLPARVSCCARPSRTAYEDGIGRVCGCVAHRSTERPRCDVDGAVLCSRELLAQRSWARRRPRRAPASWQHESQAFASSERGSGALATCTRAALRLGVTSAARERVAETGSWTRCRGGVSSRGHRRPVWLRSATRYIPTRRRESSDTVAQVRPRRVASRRDVHRDGPESAPATSRSRKAGRGSRAHHSRSGGRPGSRTRTRRTDSVAVLCRCRSRRPVSRRERARIGHSAQCGVSTCASFGPHRHERVMGSERRVVALANGCDAGRAARARLMFGVTRVTRHRGRVSRHTIAR
jgi:hypothetical protein